MKLNAVLAYKAEDSATSCPRRSRISCLIKLTHCLDWSNTPHYTRQSCYSNNTGHLKGKMYSIWMYMDTCMFKTREGLYTVYLRLASIPQQYSDWM